MAQHLIGGVSSILIGRNTIDAEVVLGSESRGSVGVVAQPPTAAIARRLARSCREAGVTAEVRVLPDGEGAKDLAVVADLYEWMSAAHLTRSDALIAVGGGALTDTAGFAAATYLRGIDAFYVSTTLLGAVDASIGGKTGVNLRGKNLVGAFRHPVRVVIDVDVLDRLPAGLKRDGAAEALKAGLIGDERLVETLERDGLEADLEEVVERSVAVKVSVVNADFEEQGIRAHLNYGHTIGHAVEVAGSRSHGEAVAIGMVAAGRASAIETGFAGEDRQREAIVRLGLPVAAPDVAADRVLDLLALDKKRGSAGLRMVVLDEIGRPRVVPVSSATVEAALEAIDIC